jgi:hypothetical protein
VNALPRFVEAMSNLSLPSFSFPMHLPAVELELFKVSVFLALLAYGLAWRPPTMYPAHPPGRAYYVSHKGFRGLLRESVNGHPLIAHSKQGSSKTRLKKIARKSPQFPKKYLFTYVTFFSFFYGAPWLHQTA